MKFTDFKIGNKIAIGFFGVISVFIGICLFLIIGMNTMKSLEDMSEKRAFDAIKMAQYEMLIDELYSVIADGIINRNISETEKNLKTISIEIAEAVEVIKSMADTNEEKALSAEIEQGFTELSGMFEKELFNDFKTGRFDLNKIQNVDGRIDLIRDKLDGYMSKYSESLIAESKEASAEFDEVSRELVIWAVLISLIGVIVGIFFTYIITKSVTGPVRKGLAFAELIAQGNFLERIDLDQKDELGQLGKALNTSADNLEKLISEIIMASQNLVRAVEEIASGNENLSQRTSEQASSLEEIAATVEETNASTRQNSGNSNEANTLAETSSRLAVDGGHIVEKAVLSIGEINKSSKKISEIINMINEIAFQTNLLALNAAVEAARAGEQGRGFAVVAGEVRNLAQRSAGAAKEIGTLIKDSISKIDEGTDLVNKSGEALKEIILSAKQVKDIIAEIAASSDEQSRGIDQINTAVNEMDTMTQQNAALVEETAAASEEMSNQAQELLSMVQEFKIRDHLTSGVQSSKRKEVHIKTLQTKAGAGKIPVKSEAVSAKKYNPEHDGYEKF